jgi:hypothetical protein
VLPLRFASACSARNRSASSAFNFDGVRAEARRLPAAQGWFDLANYPARTGIGVMAGLGHELINGIPLAGEM